jgi:hypothetical protein
MTVKRTAIILSSGAILDIAGFRFLTMGADGRKEKPGTYRPPRELKSKFKKEGSTPYINTTNYNYILIILFCSKYTRAISKHGLERLNII